MMDITTIAIIGGVGFFAGIIVTRFLMGSRQPRGLFDASQPYFPSGNMSPTSNPVNFTGVPQSSARVGNHPAGPDIVLVQIGSKKIEVIKVIRELTDMGLADAKKASETLPNVLFSKVSDDFATYAKGKLEAAGATVDVRRKL